MTQPVDVPLLGGFMAYAYPLLFAVRSVVLGLVAGGVVTFLLVKVLRRGMAGRWRIALTTGVVLFLVVTAWSWLSWSGYTWVRVAADAVELRYATWPRPGERIAFDQVESVSLSTWGRKGRSYALVITTKPGGPHAWRWESVAGDEENILLAIQWIQHASGGRVARR